MNDRFNLIDLTTVRKKLQTAIDRTQTQLDVVKQVVEALHASAGKQITARIANNLAKQYPSLRFRVSQDYSWFSLWITGEGFDAIGLNLGYNTEPKVIDLARIEKHNQRYLLNGGRLVKYRAELPLIEENAKAYNDALRAVVHAEGALYEVKWAITENDRMYVYDHNGRRVE